MNTKFKIGDRVFYKDNGPEDVGTVVEVGIYSPHADSPLNRREEIVYGVEWETASGESDLIPDSGGFVTGQLQKVECQSEDR